MKSSYKLIASYFQTLHKKVTGIELSMATKLKSLGDETLDYKAFSVFYHKLVIGIKSSLLDVAIEAFSRGLISPSVKSCVADNHFMQTKEARANYLLEAILEKIQNSPSSFEDFADVLESIPSLGYLAEGMREEKKCLLTKQNEKRVSFGR